MLTDNDRAFMKLVLRSPDIGDGWRAVSSACWPLVVAFSAKELIETNCELKTVRLSDKGETVFKYL